MVRSLKVLAVALSLSLGGCYGLGGYDVDYGSGRPGPAVVSGALTVSNGIQSGSMGSIAGFDGAASEHAGSYDTYGSYLRIDTIGSDYWVMSVLNITGDLAGPAFAPGTHRTYTSGVWDSENNVSVTGCSGPSYGNYTFDGPADQVTIDIEDLGDGTRRMNFETNYGGNVTTGSVDYRIDATSGTTSPAGI